MKFVEITIEDTGIGIPPEKYLDIFKSFEQVDATIAREYGGSGLGLSITKQLIELHGGDIRVESVPGKGSKFIFTLPASSDKPEPAVSNRISSVHSSESATTDLPVAAKFSGADTLKVWSDTFSILAVDDEPVNLQVIANILSLENYTLTRARSGQEALEMIEQGLKPDLILLDVMMPRMSGYEVCAKLREKTGGNELPIVLVTAKNQVQDLVEGFDSGANDYLAKPFAKAELLTRIKTHIRLSRTATAYGRFVPHEFLKFLNKESLVEVRLGDQVQREMTILFSDIRSFTGLSETMTPEENFNFLNAFFRRVGPVIRQHKGFIDKFIGDAIMALFPESPGNAVDAAIAMRKMLFEYNRRRISEGFLPIDSGTGIHTGTLMLGTIGEEMRMDSTVISDAVNLTARLEGLSKTYGASIVISENALTALADRSIYRFRFLDKVKVKGKKVPVSVFEILDGEPEEIIILKMETIGDFEHGTQLYHGREFTQACVFFRSVLQVNHADRASQLYLKKCEHFMVHEPPAEWESPNEMTEK